MDILVEVYATKDGEYLGKARFLGDVTIASVIKPDLGQRHILPYVTQAKRLNLLSL